MLKPKIIWLIVLSSVAAYVYAADSVDPWRLAWLVIGGTLVSGGAAAFNMVFEAGIDAKMVRTMRRPIPSGRISRRGAAAFATALSVLGLVTLAVFVGMWTAFFAFLSLLIYDGAYVYLKTKHWSYLPIGALVGVTTMLAGWVAAKPITPEAVALSLSVYVWILPHLWALAHKYVSDYASVGVKALPVINPGLSSVVTPALAIFSGLYLMALYAYLYGPSPLILLLVPPTAVTARIAIRAMRSGDPDDFWRLFKLSSPLLTVFLILVIVAELA